MFGLINAIFCLGRVSNQRGSGHWAVYYTSPKSFIIAFFEVPPQIMTSHDKITNERPVYFVIDQW